MKAIRSIVVLLLGACVTPLFAQTPAAITTDPPADAAHPASAASPDIPSHGGKMYAQLYTAAGAGPHPTLLMLHGFPGNEKNVDIAQAVRRAGWNVLVPFYRGAWGSPGTFSFTHAMEDSQACVDFLVDPKTVKAYAIDPKRIVVLGHSMGGFMAAWAARDPRVAGLIMISAWDIGADVGMGSSVSPTPNEEFTEDAARLAGTSAAKLWQEAHTHAQQWDFTSWAPQLKTKPVLIIGSDDHSMRFDHDMFLALQKAGDTKVKEVHIPTDHLYSGKRIELESETIRWLEQFGK
ncbi:MAG: alpha/beta hydrolase family protein [Bryobacteraceae bacterium]